MNFVLSPTLEQRALAKIAINLWSHDDVIGLMDNFICDISTDNWQEIESAVIERSLKFELPKLLHEVLLEFIAIAGFQILSWIELHQRRYRFVTKVPKSFVWTPLGTIDSIATAKLLIRNGILDGCESFALASLYCLEDEIKNCWNVCRISLCRSAHYHTDLYSRWYDTMCYGLKLVTMKKYPSYMSPYYTPLILKYASSGNEAAVKYFLQKVNTKEGNLVVIFAREIAWRLSFPRNVCGLDRYAAIIIFLLSKMNLEQKEEIFANHAYAVLKCFLVWPWRSLFLEIVKDLWDFLSKRNYSDLLRDMAYFVNYKHNHHILFREFWKQSPSTYKQFATEQDNIVDILMRLCQRGDEKNIKLILNDSSISAKENIIFGLEGEHMFHFLINFQKWNLVEFFIHECIPSQEDLMRFKRKLINYATTFHSEGAFKTDTQWNTFFQLVEGYIIEYNK